MHWMAPSAPPRAAFQLLLRSQSHRRSVGNLYVSPWIIGPLLNYIILCAALRMRMLDRRTDADGRAVGMQLNRATFLD
jgi:hypothetical protein